MANGFGKVVCPGCGEMVQVTNGARSPGQSLPIIQAHNPPPGNKKGANPEYACPASEQRIEEGQLTQAA